MGRRVLEWIAGDASPEQDDGGIFSGNRFANCVVPFTNPKSAVILTFDRGVIGFCGWPAFRSSRAPI